MNVVGLDLGQLSKLTTDFIEEVQCLECCKYYMAPATAACGHTLCHTCWMGRRTCPECGVLLNRKAVKPNIPLQTLTHYVQSLAESFEKLFNIKLDNIFLEHAGEIDSEKDRDKNVKNWLTSSQNHFSATIQNTEPFSQESQQLVHPVEVSTNNVIIHSDAKKSVSPRKVAKVFHVTQPQDDWDKIEPMPDTETILKCNENVVGPMDIEPFYVDDIEYTPNHPRRSSRKKDLKENEYHKVHESLHNKLSSRELSSETEKKSQKPKQTWSNVKKMRKEFNKLKANKSKLNVSIDMVKKKIQTKPIDNNPIERTEQVVNIDENTPNNFDKENQFEIVNSDDFVEKIVDSLSSKKAINNDEHCTKINAQPNSNKISVSNEKAAMNKNHENIINPPKIVSSANSKSQFESDINSKNITMAKMPFIKKSSLCPRNVEIRPIDCQISKHANSDDSEDIEISIKVRNIITNIVITKKNEVQVKTNVDREVQTSSGPQNTENESFPNKENLIGRNIKYNNENNTESESNVATSTKTEVTHNKVNKSTSGKKDTASADTVTAQFEITESVEKELLNAMECEIERRDGVETDSEEPKTVNKNKNIREMQVDTTKDDNIKNFDHVNDPDIFNSGSVKQVYVQMLKEHTPSEILTSTVRTKSKTQRNIDKRNRDNSDENALPKNKKAKITQEIQEKNTLTDSEAINYDAIMGQVFANIDADIEEKQNTNMKVTLDQEINRTRSNKDIIESQLKNNDMSQIFKPITQNYATSTTNVQEFNEKDSENIFSNFEKLDENFTHKDYKTTQQVDLLTPVCLNVDSSQESHDGSKKTNKSNRKLHDYDDSDRSVVEETPQKQVSVSKLKRANTSTLSQNMGSGSKKIPSKASTQNKSVINLSDTLSECNRSNKEQTVVETENKKHTPETPLTITKFSGDIKHKSTPVARKSLNYSKQTENIEDPEETLFPLTDVVAKTTLEKEFMKKAFESTPLTPVTKPLMVRNMPKINKNYCLAGSCLTPSEIVFIKTLCAQYKWTYVDRYTKDITHLVVGVDEENKSQRSVKYMCALAASKWIVSFNWVNSCIQNKGIVNEVEFEALDSCGEPGPRRSRVAKQKLFQGIKFYCMPPFSVLDVDTLKGMLLAAGGRVMSDMREVTVLDDNCEPALLLAEPEHTQEDRFIYLAMENKIVPVNYEWVLNCLGSYTLSSIQDLLLCPSTLLPKGIANWPEVLLLNEDE